MNTQINRLPKKIFITVKVKLLTGLRIGDNKENIDIGGVDNPVVRRKDNQEPYIPGSSIKGKIRSLIEQVRGENSDGKCKNNGKVVADFFGSIENKDLKLPSTPSKLIIRDAYLTKDVFDEKGNLVKEGWATKLFTSDFTDMPYTEVKWENNIHRIKGTAENPRQQERVPAGAEFEFNFVINIWTDSPENHFMETFLQGLELLESDYLGGSGTRGYGQITFKDFEMFEKSYNLNEDKDTLTINESDKITAENLLTFKEVILKTETTP